MKINSISTTHDTFPERLRTIPSPPTRLYFKGSLAAYSLGVAIVGTRKPTAYGRHVTADLAGRLAERGAAIISGLAHGIDGIAHEAALTNGGHTIAVLACGLDRVYPAAHHRLATSILEHDGTLLSEYATGTPPQQYRFLERNRLVSGLADVIIVTEAGLRSGTMNTTMHALEQGRDVYAVPGPITSAMSAGCNALIAQGATPIVSVEAFLETLLPSTAAGQMVVFGHNAEEDMILQLLRSGESDGDSIQKQSGLDAALFTRTLTMLELRGAIKALGANRWSL
jgi:DNA processing protein